MTAAKAAAFFGDYENDRMFAVNSSFDSLIDTIATAAGPYPVDQSGSHVLPITRRAQQLDVIAVDTLANVGSIPLSHTPRSTAYRSSTGLLLVAGGDRACTSVIDLNNRAVVALVGDQRIITHRSDFGGGLASGHPAWVSDDTFLLLDRVSRTLALYDIKKTRLHEIHAPTSIHHVIQKDESWYGCCEGNPSSHIPPGLFRFQVANNKLVVTGNAWLPAAGKSVTDMGGHHIDLHPDGNTIYFGSVEGRIFVVNRHTLKIEKVVYTGLGTGHTDFAEERNLAFVINHTDTHITVIDSRSHEVIKNIPVASSPGRDGRKSIGHTFTIDSEKDEFICLASMDGSLVRINMDTLTVKAKLEFDPNGSYTPQGCFVQAET